MRESHFSASFFSLSNLYGDSCVQSEGRTCTEFLNVRSVFDWFHSNLKVRMEETVAPTTCTWIYLSRVFQCFINERNAWNASARSLRKRLCKLNVQKERVKPLSYYLINICKKAEKNVKSGGIKECPRMGRFIPHFVTSPRSSILFLRRTLRSLRRWSRKDRLEICSAGNRKYEFENYRYPFPLFFLFFFAMRYVKAFAFVEVLTVASILEFKSRGTWLNAGLPRAFSRTAKICAHSVWTCIHVHRVEITGRRV